MDRFQEWQADNGEHVTEFVDGDEVVVKAATIAAEGPDGLVVIAQTRHIQLQEEPF